MGIIFDKYLTFKNHVDVIAQKRSKFIFILFQLSKHLTINNDENIMVLSHQSLFLNGITVWHDTYASITTDVFINLQKRPTGPFLRNDFSAIIRLLILL